MKALEPLKVITSNNGGSYAYQAFLGWCIVEQISNMVGKDSVDLLCVLQYKMQ